MADYKRRVSYMYQYENGVKRKNVGYARVEAKNGQCKITLHMQLLGQLDSIFPTYLIQREANGIELLYLGDTVLKNQVMDSKLTADENNIMNSGHSLSEMSGLLLFLHDNVFFATEWDDKPIDSRDVLEALKPKKQEAPPEEEKKPVEVTVAGLHRADRVRPVVPEYERRTAPVQAPAGMPQYKLPHYVPLAGTGYDPLDSAWTEEQVDLLQNLQQESKLESMEDELLPQTDLAEEAQQDNISADEAIRSGDNNTDSDITAEEMKSKAGNNTEKPDPAAAKHFFDTYPRIYPFEDNEIILCVKIEPKDIGMLPKELWALSNNSFLMHGYYCYHHLIFAKLKDRYGCRYILGIPGIYHNRERFMARMFGFESFKSIRRRELQQGDFGYWLLEVNF